MAPRKLARKKPISATQNGAAPSVAEPVDTPAVDAPALRPPSLPFPVVGIGASAGGLEALTQMLQALPVDTGMAFVLVQHLDPTHASMLTEILSRATRMPMQEVKDQMPVEPDHVYVIPPATNMIFSNGVLQLSLRKEARGQHRPIDHFLRSLAQDQGYNTIGVILSGSATDGTRGCQEIKAEGGITFAQDDTAQHDSMPRSAVAAGCIDFVLPPARIAAEIARIAHHPLVSPASRAQREAKAGEADIAAVLDLLRTATGVDFTHYKRNTLYRRISRRMVLHRKEGLKEYARFLASSPGEAEALYQDILINVTSFFRDPEGFETLKTEIFPRLTNDRPRDLPVRIWVLGCSTGEEAYAIAMAFTEFAETSGKAMSAQIFATDVNGAGIETARAGVYSKNIAQDVSPERLRRFFVEVDGSYKVGKSIREMMVFARHNALTDPPFSRVDLISCRNLLIYLDPVLQSRLVPMLHYALAPNGVLWLGKSETIGSYRELFQPEDSKHKIFFKRPGAPRMVTGMPVVARLPGGHASLGAAPVTTQEIDPLSADLQKEADRLLLTRYAPAGVVVNSDLEILQFRGDTGPYLVASPGRASLNLVKMLREGLLLPVRAALQKAKREQVTVREEGLRVKSNGGQRKLNAEVVPLKGSTQRETCYLVLFENATPAPARRSRVEASSKDRRSEAERDSHEEAARLQKELTATREYLQSVVEQHDAAVEELQSANEEAQSANEELQTINEELETSKEEIESSSEELATVNDELNNRNRELHQVNNDLINLLGSVQMAILMLGPDFRIRRFTPAAEKILNLIGTDVGRPVGDIKLRFDVPDLEQLLAQVIETVSPMEREVQDKEGRWYSLRIRPYRTLENKIDGAVLVLVDVDAMKRVEESLTVNEERLRIVRDQAPVAICEIDLDGRYIHVNNRYCAISGYTREELLGKRFTDIDHPDDAEADLTAFQQAVRAATGSFRVEKRIVHKGGHVVWVETDGFVVLKSDGTPRFAVGIVQDILKRKRVQHELYESEARFQLAADSAPVLIWVNGLEGCEFVNRAYQEFVGVGEVDVRGFDWAQFIHPDDRDAYLASYLDAFGRRARFEAQCRLRRADGVYRWLHAVGVPRYTSGGEFLGYVGSSFDITDMKQAEESLREADRAKNRFLAVLAHELRGPLAPMRNAAQLLHAPGADEERLEWVRSVMDRQIRTISRMIDDLLDVSRITQGKMQLKKEPVELATILNRAVETIRSTIESRGQQLAIELPSQPVHVKADVGRLEQVFSNLLHNASKFTREKGHIWLRATPPDSRLPRADAAERSSMVEIRVRDDGDGIDPDFLPHVFDAFLQADRTFDRAHGGLGIGLTLVRSLVELHGGSVEAKSDGRGRGSEFVVRLPTVSLRKRSTPTETPQVHQSIAPDKVSRRILVVDDHADARDTLAVLLRSVGHDVRIAVDGATALETAKGFQPQVVFLDIGLPGMDGFEVGRRLRELKGVGHMVLVAISGYGQEEDRRRARESGFDHYFTKPVGFQTVRDFIASPQTSSDSDIRVFHGHRDGAASSDL